MTTTRPWFNPDKWLVNPAYWEPDAIARRQYAPARVRFIDCTLTEGDDCVGHQLNWNTRLGLMQRLAEAGVDEITLPSHAAFDDELDLVRAYRRLGLRAPLVAKGPGIEPPLRSGWKERIDHHLTLGVEIISPIVKWPFRDTLNDFSAELTKQAVVDAIGESVGYMKTKGVRVVPWIVDAMRTNPETAATFFKAMAQAGADGVYVVDSRGNSVPLATYGFIRRVREAVGTCDIYVQHHNDLGVATANALADVEAGANVIDASVLGIGDRGGCVALEEAAVLFAMYGIETNINLERLYELGRYTQAAFGVQLAPWKPVIGESWNKEEGAGHLEGALDELATIGIAPTVIGRKFEGVIGTKILFGRERSSAATSDPTFLLGLLAEWGLQADTEQFERILRRSRQAVATSYDRHYLTVDEFRAISEGVLGTP